MDKELIKNNLLEYAEKSINNGYCDEFVINNFKFALNRKRIITFFLNDESKNAEINNILSAFIKEFKYSQYYFKEMLFDQELKIKLIELFLVRLRFLKEKSKIEYYQKNKEKAKEYQKEYYQKNKEKFEKYQNKDQDEINKKKEEKRNVNKEKSKEYQKEYYKRNKEKLNKYRKEYHHKNIEKSKEYQKKYQKEYRKIK
jgi:hypothetical protein